MNDLINVDTHIMQSADVDTVERLMVLRRELMADEARKAYQRDFAALQSVLPAVQRKGKSDFQTKKHGRVMFSYSHIDDLTKALQPFMQQYGFSFAFQQKEWNGQVAVACVVMHYEGHRERFAMSAPIDTSGCKNVLQAIASTITYLKRITFKSAFGISETDKPPQRANDQKQYYSTSQFKTNFPVWQLKIRSGRLSPQQLLGFLQSKGINLSPEQQRQIQTCGE